MNLKAGRTWIVVLLIVAAGFLWLTRKATAPTTPSSTTQIDSPQDTVSPKAAEKYVPYSDEGLAAAAGKRKLLFFHASWCPTCRVANQNILNNADQLPEDLIIFKTDYDTETALKKKYNITYQHTFVLVDDQGNEIKQWNGGSVAEILEQI